MDKQVTKEQIGSIVTLLVAGKVPFKDAQDFINKYKSAPSAKKNRDPITKDDYPIQVTRVTNPTTSDLDSLYAVLNECWDDQGHPENPNCAPHLHQTLRGVTPCLGKKVVRLKKFYRPMSISQVLDWAAEYGYRLALPCEREAFVRRHLKNLLDKFGGALKIIDFGCHSSGKYPHVPLIEGTHGPSGWRPKLNAYLLNSDAYGPEFSFLLIKLED